VGHGFSRDKNKTPSSHVRLRAFCASLSRQPWLLPLSLQLPPPRSVYVVIPKRSEGSASNAFSGFAFVSVHAVIPLALTKEGTEARPCADEGPLFDFAFAIPGAAFSAEIAKGPGLDQRWPQRSGGDGGVTTNAPPYLAVIQRSAFRDEGSLFDSNFLPET
jgi:hypothetical protein